MSTENSELKLMTDDDIQSFIMDGIFSISPGVSVSTHQEIHKSLVHSCAVSYTHLTLPTKRIV